nr:MAG TPA: hypothetical protein [Caudoviricetes sp.]
MCNTENSNFTEKTSPHTFVCVFGYSHSDFSDPVFV